MLLAVAENMSGTLAAEDTAAAAAAATTTTTVSPTTRKIQIVLQSLLSNISQGNQIIHSFIHFFV